MYDFVILAMSNDDAPSVTRVLREFVGPGPTIQFLPSNGIYNGCTTVVSSTWILVLFDGTRNAQQAALQAFNAVLGPQDFGGLSTNPFWFESSTIGMQKMQLAGQTPLMRVMCVGHSYGGAVACLVAARNKQADAHRTVHFLTLGCPKIGDTRFVRLLQTCNGLNLANDGDLVTVLPPDRHTLIPLLPFFPGIGLLVWAQWQRALPSALLRSDGSLLPNQQTRTDTATIATLVAQVLAQQALDPIIQHFLVAYGNRLFARCPDCCFPTDDDICEDIIVSNPVIGFTTAAKPERGLVFRPGVPIIVDGTTCAKAFSFVVGQVLDFGDTTPTPQWWKIVVPNGTLLHAEMVNTDFGVSECDFWYGPDCAHRTYIDRLSSPMGPECVARTTATDGIWFFQIFNSVGASTLRVTLGPC
jgi:pimeloyl-ACP methyl ester carboxylesterase